MLVFLFIILDIKVRIFSRISKLKEITGLDVRKPTESPALYLAYIITDELINEKYDLPLLLHNTK